MLFDWNTIAAPAALLAWTSTLDVLYPNVAMCIRATYAWRVLARFYI